MKKCIISLMIGFILFLIVQDVSAQKRFLFGTQVNAGIGNRPANEFSKAQALNLTVYLGYYVNQQTVIGFGMGYQDISIYNQGIIGGTLNAFVRRYANKEKQLGFYGEGGIRFHYSKYYSTTDFGVDVIEESQSRTWETYIGPGVELPLGKKWQINAMWGNLLYRNSHQKEDGISSHQFRLDLHLNTLRFNLNYLF